MILLSAKDRIYYCSNCGGKMNKESVASTNNEKLLGAIFESVGIEKVPELDEEKLTEVALTIIQCLGNVTDQAQHFFGAALYEHGILSDVLKGVGIDANGIGGTNEKQNVDID